MVVYQPTGSGAFALKDQILFFKSSNFKNTGAAGIETAALAFAGNKSALMLYNKILIDMFVARTNWLTLSFLFVAVSVFFKFEPQITTLIYSATRLTVATQQTFTFDNYL